jgi:hypothetical protein
MRSTVFVQACILAIVSVAVGGCYTYHDRSKVLIPNIDIDQTLEIAEQELQSKKRTSVLTVWAIRDQVLTKAQAERVSELYFKYIDKVDSEEQKARSFAVWHFTWAISNIYRQGEQEIKDVMAEAYRDAAKRVEKLEMKIATSRFYGDKIYMGDTHSLGRSYSKRHLVVPGNEDYLQSVSEYEPDEEEEDD